MKQATFIDSHKGVTGLIVFFMMLWGDRLQSPTAWTYLALHGTYGVLWVWKSRVFPDAQWEQRAPLWYGLVIWGGLSTYWVAPAILVSQRVEAQAWWMGLCVVLFGLGVFLHFASDMQKHMHLQHRRGVLLTDGLWARCRNPNYLGELLIYGSFALLVQHWIPGAILALWVVAIWIPNMVKKDRSLSRYPAYAHWRQQTWMLLMRPGPIDRAPTSPDI
jgi:protein-S-isoprenylcysteine O-methyltransferase Ste14